MIKKFHLSLEHDVIMISREFGQLSQCSLVCLTPCFLNYFQVILFAILHAEQLEHNARAIKLIQNQLETKPNSVDLEQKLIQLYEKLDWTHCTHFAKESLPTRFPTDFELH